MKYIYHGSCVPNLKVIKKNKSTHNKNWVYGTYSKAIATIFLSKKGCDLYYYLSGDGVNYPIVLVERKKEMFDEIFNVSGYIYKLGPKNFKDGMTGWSAEVVSDKDEKVIGEEYISNVYDELKKLDSQGKIKLYLYPDRPINVPIDNSDLIAKVIRWEKNGFDISRFLNLYPELKEQYLKRKMNNLSD